MNKVNKWDLKAIWPEWFYDFVLHVLCITLEGRNESFPLSSVREHLKNYLFFLSQSRDPGRFFGDYSTVKSAFKLGWNPRFRSYLADIHK